MAPHPAAAAGIAVSTVVALLVGVVVTCQLPCVTGGGVTTTQAFDGTATLGLGQCAADEQELARKPTAARYISYAALRADQIPCDKRGRSYYTDCGSMQQMNPYTRGCSAITRCARNMN